MQLLTAIIQFLHKWLPQENQMRKTYTRIMTFALVVQIFSFWLALAQSQVDKGPYPTMAPLDRYMVPDENAEIALARSAAPASIASAAEVMVLRRDGYTRAVKGSNGFVCIVERSWANTTDDPQFWNPKMRAPHCFNSPAAKTFLPIYLMKSELVLAGRSRAEIAAAIASAIEKKELPALAPGTMVYMMSKQQYLNDGDMGWHPHLMFFVSGDAEKSWGANLPGSPVMAAYDPEQRVTTFFVLASEWSDGTPGPPMTH
jgi:hypothetical protein